MKKLLITLLLLLSLSTLNAQGIINDEDQDIKVFFNLEWGWLKLLHHTIKIGVPGTNFNYITQGGQEILFPFQRFTIETELFNNHLLSFLYQPLAIETKTRFLEDVTIDGVTFWGGTNMALKYGFPFWRLTYNYAFLKGSWGYVGAGLALQIRNASIVFEALNGSGLTVGQNLGPVPAINLRGRYVFNNAYFIESDITGLYASSAIINGANFNFEGSILDASLRAGIILVQGAEAFLNVRFLGGSAAGTSQYPDSFWTESQENYTNNYLATLSLTAGLTLK
ncbi:MAG: hypothetical protein JXR70_02130 [Spirochaetales bacterium]|nr:hypothetical protein [Spirochaetales bacterium]